jgi:hypothetical protein
MKGDLYLLAIGWAGLWCLCGPFWLLWLHRRVRNLSASERLQSRFEAGVKKP